MKLHKIQSFIRSSFVMEKAQDRFDDRTQWSFTIYSSGHILPLKLSTSLRFNTNLPKKDSLFAHRKRCVPYHKKQHRHVVQVAFVDASAGEWEAVEIIR